MLDVLYSTQARKFILNAEKTLAKRLLERIEKLRSDPTPRDTKKVEGYKEKTYRVRVGDYRILYEVNRPGHFLGIVKIDKRPRAY